MISNKDVIDAYCKIREIDCTIPDDVLDFMKDCALEKLNIPICPMTGERFVSLEKCKTMCDCTCDNLSVFVRMGGKVT